jgi:hypothetical protein
VRQSRFVFRRRSLRTTFLTIRDSRLKEETADRPYCDMSCAEEGTQNAVPSSDSIPASACPQRGLPIGTSVPPCAVALGSRRLRGCGWLGCTRPFHRKGPLDCRHRANPTPVRFHAFTRPPINHTDELLLLPTFQQTCPDKTKFWVTGSAVQPSAGLPSSHSFHGEVCRSGRLLLSIPLVQLRAAHKPKPRRARFRALRLRSAPEIDSASLRSFPCQL